MNRSASKVLAAVVAGVAGLALGVMLVTAANADGGDLPATTPPRATTSTPAVTSAPTTAAAPTPVVTATTALAPTPTPTLAPTTPPATTAVATPRPTRSAAIPILPVTGGNSWLLLTAGLTALAAGIALVLLTRRRRA